MPGRKRLPKPSAYLIELTPDAGPMMANAEDTPHQIEAFPLVDGVVTPLWAELPKRRIVTDLRLFAYPEGARKLPVFEPTGAPVFNPVAPGTVGGKKFLFVSEGYGDDGGEKFFTDCRRMAAAVLAQQPFKKAAKTIRIDGLFLPLRGGAVVDIGCGRTDTDVAQLKRTLFGTQSCFTPNIPQLWAGDETRVRTLVANALPTGAPRINEFAFIAVLINSVKYGGAGSSGPITLKPRIAWATTDHVLSPNVLLHELGHAFGLQDEYAFDDEVEYTPPPKPWRNISAHREPKYTPWEPAVTQDRDQLTHAAGNPWPADLKAVGTFQGAGYDFKDRYRPSRACRMRNPEDAFCAVCSEVILAELDPTVRSRIGEED